MTHITEQDVESVLGPGWGWINNRGGPAPAVQQANDWLLSHRIPLPDNTDQPDRIKRAGAYLSKLSADGKLYTDSSGDVKRVSVKADTVEVEEEYADGSKEVSADMAYVKDLLRPWLNPHGSVAFLRRL